MKIDRINLQVIANELPSELNTIELTATSSSPFTFEVCVALRTGQVNSSLSSSCAAGSGEATRFRFCFGDQGILWSFGGGLLNGAGLGGRG